MTEPPLVARGVTAGLVGGALAIAVVTVVARVVGLGRWVVFSKTVGGGCLADAYNTANLVPNVLFEVVAGGALAGAVVPVLAGAVARSDRDAVDRTVSALLSWTLLLLLPVSLATAAAARPAVKALLGDDADCAGAVDAGARMLLMFTPQLLCYGAAVVLGGALQAHRRFLAAAVAPLVSSTVVIAAYLTFVALADGERSVAAVPRSAEAALALGTTLGVAALALTVAVPLRGTGIRIRPTLTFPAGVLPRVRALAGAGLAVLLAQQATLLVIAWLANHSGDPGAMTAYTWSWAVYLVPYAVLAVPISRVFASNGGLADSGALADGIATFAPGLVGFGLVAHLTRVLYAGHHGRAAANAAVAGWAVVVVADITVVAAVADRHAVAALGAGNAIGMTTAGVLLLLAVLRAHGAAALAGIGRTAGLAVLGAVLGAAVGTALGRSFDDAGFAAALGGTAACAAVSAALFLGVVAAGDRPTLTSLADKLRARSPGADTAGAALVMSAPPGGEADKPQEGTTRERQGQRDE
jgi:putative peptidoglycan lipid II flippase